MDLRSCEHQSTSNLVCEILFCSVKASDEYLLSNFEKCCCKMLEVTVYLKKMLYRGKLNFVYAFETLVEHHLVSVRE